MTRRACAVRLACALAAGGAFAAAWPAAAGAQTAPPPPTTTTTTAADPAGGDLFVTPTTSLPATAPGEEPARSDPGPGFWDIGGRIRKAVNDWFRNLVADALGPVLDLVGRTVLSTPDVSAPGRARDLWLVSMAIANSLFVVFVTIGGFVLMGHETLQSSYALKDLLPRIVVGWVGANISLWLVGVVIRLANAASAAFLGAGHTDHATAADGLRTMGVGLLNDAGGVNIAVVLLLVVVLVLAIGIVAAYVVRVANVIVLAAAGPILVAAYAMPRAEGAARLWWRALTASLLVQVGQALILSAAVRVFFDADGQRAIGIPGGPFMDAVLVGCLFWSMLRLPTYAGRLVFAPRPVSLTRYYMMGRALGRATGPRR